MKVAVLGSSGGMGGFFVRYFLSKGATVVGSDRRRRRFRNGKFRFADSNAEAVKGADLVVVATPIEATLATVNEIAPSLGRGATVVEITSVKGELLGKLKMAVAGSRASLLSLHPLFGPALKMNGEIKLCVVVTSPRSLASARSLFPDATLIPMKAREHDRTMGVILSLTHLLNIAYAGTVIRYLSPKEFRRLQTPTSAVQLTLAEGVLSQDPSLYSYIQLENAYSSEFAGALIEELERLRRLIRAKDKKGYERDFRDLSRRYRGDSKTATDLVYQAFEKSTR